MLLGGALGSSQTPSICPRGAPCPAHHVPLCLCDQSEQVPGEPFSLESLSPHAPWDTSITRGIEVVDIEARLLYNLNHLPHLQGAARRVWDSAGPSWNCRPTLSQARAARHTSMGSGSPHLERAVQVGVVVEVALPLGAAEGLQVFPQPVGRDQDHLEQVATLT